MHRNGDKTNYVHKQALGVCLLFMSGKLQKSSEISGFKGLFLCIPVLPQKQKIIHLSLHLVVLLGFTC